MPSLKANGKRMNGKGSHWIPAWRRLAIYLRDGFRCQYCDRDLTNALARDMTLDHVLPQCQGGTHHESNLITACLSCNSRRQHMPVHVFVMRISADTPAYADTLRRIARTRKRSIAKHADSARTILSGKGQPVEAHTHCPKEV